MTQQTPDAISRAEPGRRANTILWVLQGLAVVVFVMAGLTKVASESQTVEAFDDIGFGDWFRYMIGILELIGAVALAIPRLCGLAAAAFTGLMIGAVIFSLVFFEASSVITPAIILVLVAYIAWGRRDRTAELIRWSLRGGYRSGQRGGREE